MTEFTAPTTYDEAKALLGIEVETPMGMLRCASTGLSGSEFHLGFYLPGNTCGTHDFTWSLALGWESLNETRARVWNQEWRKLSANCRQLIDTVIGAELADMPVERRKHPAKLLRIAKRKLIKNGVIAHSPCGRCGGSGNFSYCERFGTTCFSCNGSGKVLPTTLQALKSVKGAER